MQNSISLVLNLCSLRFKKKKNKKTEIRKAWTKKQMNCRYLYCNVKINMLLQLKRRLLGFGFGIHFNKTWKSPLIFLKWKLLELELFFKLLLVLLIILVSPLPGIRCWFSPCNKTGCLSPSLAFLDSYAQSSYYFSQNVTAHYLMLSVLQVYSNCQFSFSIRTD